MFTWFKKKTVFLKTVIITVTAQFILNSIPAFAYETLDHLRPGATTNRDGGNALMVDLIEARQRTQRDGGSFLRIVPQNVHKGKGSSDVGLGFTIEQMLALGLESAFLGHTSTRERYGTETKENLEGTSRFDEIINHRIKILRGFVRRDEFERENFNSEALFPKLIEKGYLSQYWRVNPKFAGLDDDFKTLLKNSPFSYTDKQIKQIEAILQQALSTKKKIKEIHLGVGSVRKNIPLMVEKEDIESQLGMDLKDITIDDLKEVNFNISYEPSPSIDIKSLKDEELIAMIQEVHQRIYWWFTKNYGDEEINSIWGKRLKILFRGSVIKDNNKDNATPIMSVKVKTKEDEEIPGVHGVVFFTSGKKVEGYLGVMQVVQEAAKRDGLQYVTLINLKSITADDKERTLQDEYVDQIYAALNAGRFDRNHIIAEVAPPDIELEKWLELIAKAEDPKKIRVSLGREPSVYGPHQMQEGLRPLYEKISWARTHSTRQQFVIKNIYAFRDQKHGMAPVDAISFGLVLGDDTFIVENAPVMGGLSAGGLEPDTHPNIKAAIDFFNKNVSSRLKGLSVAQPDGITEMIVKIDEEFKKQSQDKTLPRFSYIGAELAVGVSMISTVALAEVLHVPAEVIINYRYNEYAMSHGLAKEPRPMSIPVDFSVVWEGGKHGVAKYLLDLVKEGIIKDDSRFPARFKDPELIKKGDKSILLAMVPPQELQIMCFAPDWASAYDIGVKLTNTYQKLLKENGIKTKYGAESGFTTEQTRTADGKLITLELVLDILEQAVNVLKPEESKYVRFALDIAASEMYIPEIDMYYIGPDAAKKVDPDNVDGLVTNEQFTRYKLMLFKAHPRFISCEDWAADDQIEHWDPSAKLIMENMIQMGDDLDVSRGDLIRKHNALGIQNAHLHKPNQITEEQASMDAVGNSHKLKNVVVWSHRGTRSPQETFTAQGAMGTGSFGSKFTLWGPGRSALIAVMSQSNTIYEELGINVPYQGALALDPNGPYKDYGWAIRLREEIARDEKKIKAIEALKDIVSPAPGIITDISNVVHSAVELANKLGISNEELFDFAKEYIAYQDSEKRSSEALGLKQLRDLVEKLTQVQEAKLKPIEGSRVLEISVKQLSKNVIQVDWRFGDIKIRRNISVNTEESLNAADIITEDLKNKVIPSLERYQRFNPDRDLDLTSGEDYNTVIELVAELSKKDIYDSTFRFVKNKLLPAIKESLSARLNIQGKIQKEQEPVAVIVEAESFKSPVMYSTMLETFKLTGKNLKIGIFGESAENLRILLGGSNNIITAKTKEELLSKLTAEPFGIKLTNIRLVNVTDTPTIAMAATLTALYKIKEDTKVFDDFYGAIQKAGVITQQAYDNTKVLRARVMVEQDRRLLGMMVPEPSWARNLTTELGAIELPKIELSETSKKTIEMEKKVVSEFMASLGV